MLSISVLSLAALCWFKLCLKEDRRSIITVGPLVIRIGVARLTRPLRTFQILVVHVMNKTARPVLLHVANLLIELVKLLLRHHVSLRYCLLHSSLEDGRLAIECLLVIEQESNKQPQTIYGYHTNEPSVDFLCLEEVRVRVALRLLLGQSEPIHMQHATILD